MAEPFLRQITPRNLLSFGPDPDPIELNNLNVLIGANGSGKSNLIEIIGVIRSSPGDIRDSFRPGISDWIWKGAQLNPASIDLIIRNDHGNQPLRHVLEFRSEEQSFNIIDERIENEFVYGNNIDPYFYYKYRRGNPILNTKEEQRNLKADTVLSGFSILNQRQDPEQYPEIYYLAQQYKQIQIFREWEFGRNSTLRHPQNTDVRPEQLKEDFSNIAMHLNYLRSKPKVRRLLLEQLKNVFSGITDFDISVKGNTAQIYFIEGDYEIPATRLSDGTLRYLCLLAILCNPEPQPLICLEEPELGLHPDLLSGLVDMMRECSQRTQLIVTTHSENIVDAFSSDPESVLVCEKEDGITQMKRLNSGELMGWLKDYSLGQLWNRGEIGGTRW